MAAIGFSLAAFRAISAHLPALTGAAAGAPAVPTFQFASLPGHAILLLAAGMLGLLVALLGTLMAAVVGFLLGRLGPAACCGCRCDGKEKPPPGKVTDQTHHKELAR